MRTQMTHNVGTSDELIGTTLSRDMYYCTHNVYVGGAVSSEQTWKLRDDFDLRWVFVILLLRGGYFVVDSSGEYGGLCCGGKYSCGEVGNGDELKSMERLGYKFNTPLHTKKDFRNIRRDMGEGKAYWKRNTLISNNEGTGISSRRNGEVQ
ncbi:hypothetical protein Tco_0718386 [Tanacetum coccineum]